MLTAWALEGASSLPSTAAQVRDRATHSWNSLGTVYLKQVIYPTWVKVND